MARPTIERTLRRRLWGAGILAFVWVLSRADLRGTFPVFVAVGPVLFLALLPLLGQIALDALAARYPATDRWCGFAAADAGHVRW